MIDQSAESLSKLFVLDTNVILHDSGCLRCFQEHDVAIPITVLEELDRFKKGNEDIHFHARQFLRELDGLTGDVLSPEGVPLGGGLGSIRVILGRGMSDALKQTLYQDSPDHRILNTTLALQQSEPDRRVILVSKDTNLRLKAKSLGIPSQDYATDKIESFDKLYTGKRIVSDMPTELVDEFYQSANGSVSAADLNWIPNPVDRKSVV